MKKFFQEFKDFALKGSVIDMAVGTMIGAAFSNLVTSLVNNVMSPIIALLTGRFDSESETIKTLTVGGIEIGKFFADIFNFAIMAFCIFLFIKLINTLKEGFAKKKEEEEKKEEPTVSAEVQLLTEIKELLQEKKNG